MTSPRQSWSKAASAALLFFGALWLVLGLAARPAYAAPDAKAVKKVEDMNKKAMESFDLLEFPEAKKQLGQALVEIKKAGLDKHPVAAQTHGRLGIVYEALDDSDNALLEFIAALEIDPTWTIPKVYRTKQRDEIFKNAKATVGTTGGSPGGGEILAHVAVEDAPAGQALTITANTGSDKVKQVVLYYRAAGKAKFTSVSMSQDGNTWEGAIPSGATKGESLQYYIEAKGAGGKVLAAVGSDESPQIVSLAGGDDGGDVDGGDDKPDLGGDSDNKVPPPTGKKVVFFTVGLGTAAAISKGKGELSGQQVKSGTGPFISELLHVNVELGFFLSEHSSLSAIFRAGMPIGSDIEGASGLGPSAFLRFGYLFGSFDGLSLHGDLGAGVMRHTVKLGDGDQRFNGKTDAVASGPLFIGAGVSYFKTMGNAVALFADGTMHSVIPVTEEAFGTKLNYAFNLEITLGLRLAF